LRLDPYNADARDELEKLRQMGYWTGETGCRMGKR
jgi:hypothetical protein